MALPRRPVWIEGDLVRLTQVVSNLLVNAAKYTDDGGSITAAQADERKAALRPLDRAARRGLVAACEFPWER